MAFDPREYFASRLTEAEHSLAGSQKFHELQRASLDKITALEQSAIQKRAAEAELAKANENSVVSLLGLDPEGFTGSAVNTWMQASSGTAALPGLVGSGIKTAQAMALDAGITDEMKAARTRMLAKEATPEDMELLNRREGDEPGMVLSPYQQMQRAGHEKRGLPVRRNIDRILDMEDALTGAKDIKKLFDLSSSVHQTKSRKLTDELGTVAKTGSDQIGLGAQKFSEGNKLDGIKDISSGVVDLLMGIPAAAWNNPGAAVEVISANLPQLAMAATGVGGLVMSNALFATDVFREGIEDYRTKNNGAMPPEAEMRRMAGYAASYAASEILGDKIALGAGRALKATGTAVLKGAADDVARQGVKAALFGAGKAVLTGVPARVVGAVLQGGTGEFITEGYQAWAEKQIKNELATFEEIYTGGALGAIAGGGISGGLRTVSESAELAVKALTKSAKKDVESEAKILSRNEAQDAAIKTGDVTKLVDPKSDTYAPDRAIAALLGNARQPDATPESQDTNLTKATSIINELEESRNTANQMLQMQTEAGLNALIAENQAELDQVPEADTARRELFQEQITLFEGLKKDLPADKEAGKKARKLEIQIKTMDRQIENARGVLDAYTTDEAKNTDVGALVTAIEGADPVAAEKATNRLINLSMAAPGAITPEVATQLASNPNITLTAPQREYLRLLPDAQVARNLLQDAEGVKQDVMEGGEGFIGITAYRKNVSEALAAGNQKRADQNLAQLNKFLADHTSKAEAAAFALRKKGAAGQIVRTGINEWGSPKVHEPDEAKLRKQGGLTVYSPKLVADMALEVDALLKTSNELKAAYALKFPTAVAAATPAGATNVQNTARPQEPRSAATGTPTVGVQGAETVGSPAVTPTSTVVGTGSGVAAVPVASPVTSNAQTGSVVSRISEDQAKRLSDEGLNARLVAIEEKLAAKTATAEDRVTRDALNAEWARREAEGNTQAESVTVPTWDTLKSGEQVTLFRGESPANDQNGQWWTTDRAKAERYGAVTEVTLPVDLVVKHAARGHNGKDEFVFPTVGNRPVALRQELDKPKPYVKAVPVVSRISQAQAERLSDEGLNERLGALQDKRAAKTETAEDTATFAVLEAELSRREDDWTAQNTESTSVEDQAAPLAPTDRKPVEDQSQSNPKPTTPAAPVEVAPEQKPTKPEQAGDQQPEGTAEPSVLYKGLRILAQVKDIAAEKINEVFNTLNLVAQYFTQDQKSDAYVTQRPLATMENFLSAWKKDPETIIEFLKLDRELKENEENALNNLKAFLVSWEGAFTDQFRINEGDPDFQHLDMMRYLFEEVNGKLDIEENLRTAMSYAAYDALLDDAHSPATRTTEQMNEMHGKDKDNFISQEGQEFLHVMSTLEHVAAAEIGARVLQVMGMKLKKEGSPDMLARLETAIGMHVLLQMESKGYITRRNENSRKVMGFFVSPGDGYGAAQLSKIGSEDRTSYIQYGRDFKANPKNGLPSRVQLIRDANVKGGAITERLFQAERAKRIAGTTRVKFAQKFAKNTNQEISEIQQKGIQATMDTPHMAIPEMLAIMTGIGRANVLKIAGWIDLGDGNVQINNRIAVEAQNRNLEQQYDLMMEMLEAGGFDSEYFVEQEVWKNFRAGFLNHSLNMQTSKIHRAVFTREGFKVTIDLDNQAQVNEFLVSVGMNLGIVKTDQQPNVETLQKLAIKVEADPRLARAVDSIRKNLLQSDSEAKPWESGETADITEFALKGEGMLSLQALVAYAQYRKAVEEKEPGKTTFETTLLVGADGKTNGPILTHLALGAAVDVDAFYVLLNRGGMYSTDPGQAGHYSAYYQNGEGKDLYQDLAKQIVKYTKSRIRPVSHLIKLAQEKKWKERFSHYSAVEYAALETVTKTLMDDAGEVLSAGRNLVKTPLTAFAFGSALKRAVQTMEDKFIKELYNNLEAIRTGERKDVTPEAYIAALNVLIKQGNGKDNKAEPITETDIDKLLEFTLDQTQGKNQEIAIRNAFQNTMGTAVTAVMESYFNKFSLRRNELNKTIQAAFYVYDAAFAEAKQTELDALMDAGTLPFRVITQGKEAGKRSPKRDLTAAELAKVRDDIKHLLPVMHTHLSKQENNLAGGIYMAKQENGKREDGPYQNQIHIQNAKNNKGHASKQLNVGSMTSNEKDPGVAGVAVTMHSLDSAGMHQTLLDMFEAEMAIGMNVHDEISTNPNDIAEAARLINKATVKTFLNYSPAREALNMLERQLIDLAARVQRGKLSTDVIFKIAQEFQTLYNRGKDESSQIELEEAFSKIVNESFVNATEADKIRLGGMAKMAVMDQYTWEGGQYVVTDAERKQAADELAALPTSLSPEVKEALKSLDMLLKEAIGPTDAELAEVYGNRDRSQDDVFDLDDLPMPDEIRQLILMDGTLSMEAMQVLKDKVPELEAGIKAGMNLQGILESLTPERLSEVFQLISTLKAQVPPDTLTPFGWLGQPTHAPNPNLLAFFTANPDTTAGALIKLLDKLIAEGPENNKAFSQGLLKLLKGTVDPKMPVKLVTRTTPVESVLRPANQESAGWYVSNEQGQEAFYVLGTDFRASELRVEVLLHEMTHSALSRTVQHELDLEADAKAKGKVYTSHALELINELRELLKDAEKVAKGDFAAAFVNLHEFIAYGMTNQRFQREVLANISKERSAGITKNPLLKANGLGEFIRIMVDLLWNKFGSSRHEKEFSGLTILMMDVAGLMAEASKSKPDLALVLSHAAASPADAYTTLEVHQAIDDGSLTPEFNEQLRGLLTGIVDKLHGPAGAFKASLMRNVVSSPLEAWLKAKATGVMPFASKVMAAPFAVTPQELFTIEQVEVTMRTALAENTAQTKTAYIQLRRLYEEVRATLKPSDFSGGQAQYDFIFPSHSDTGTSRSDYLTRFAALGLANQELNTLMRFATKSDTRKLEDVKGFMARLQFIFESILTYLSNKITHTFVGQQADSKLDTLVGQLIDIEAKRKETLNRRANQRNYLAPVERGAQSLGEGVRTTVLKAAKSQFVRRNRIKVVQSLGAITQTIAEDNVQLLVENTLRLRDRHFKGVQGIAANLLTEVKGLPSLFQKLGRATKRLEQLRQATSENTRNAALMGFENNGANLTKEENASIAAALLRTGAHELLTHFTMAQLETLVTDKAELMKAINTFQAKLNPFMRYRHYFMRQANHLGFHRATGRTPKNGLRLNPYAIAAMAGTPYQGSLTSVETANIAATVAALVALHGLRYTSNAHLENIKNVLKHENERTDGMHGIENTLKIHRALYEKSKDWLFGGNEMQMLHGYVPELYNPDHTIAVANETDGIDLIEQGYRKDAQLPLDPADPDREVMHSYIQKNGGMKKRVSGSVAMISRQARGSEVYGKYRNVNTTDGQRNASDAADMAHADTQAVPDLFRAGPMEDLSKVKGHYAVPVLNSRGEVTSHRYIMLESTKDVILERDNRFENLLGELNASIFNKESSIVQNRKIFQALHDDYRENFSSAPESFVLIGDKSRDPKLKEIWKLLSAEAEADIVAIWGDKGMRVRSELILSLFGNRKLSIADFLRNDKATLNGMQKVLREWFMLYARSRGMTPKQADNFAKRIGVALAHKEDVWQEVVKEVKDIVVIKSVVVMLGNIWSNSFLLHMDNAGKDFWEHHLTAMRGITAYREDSSKLEQYELMRDAGITGPLAIDLDEKIMKLKDAIDRNPLRPMIEAGLMATIVEDLAANEDIYSQKSKLVKKVEKYTDRLPSWMQTAGKTMYMSHDTRMYKALHRTTALSDPMARYTMIQNLTTRKENPMSMEDAILHASESFVNYDIPMHPTIQYLDDMGLLYFTKYFIRIQRPLIKMAKNNPLRVLMTILVDNFIDLGPIVLEGSALGRIGNNPIESGAFKIITVVDEIAPIQAVDRALTLIKP